eukprot:8037423-Alexandrium_andersonii.AAC.1
MGEVVGPRQVLVMQFFLLAVSEAVGLHIDAHLCLGARVAAAEAPVRWRLASLPVRILGGNHNLEIRGLPGIVILRL